MNRFTPRVERAIANATAVADKYDHNYIGTEHLFIGLLMQEDGSVPRILEQCGLDPKKLLGQVIAITQPSTSVKPQKPDLKTIAKTLRDLADSLGNEQ